MATAFANAAVALHPSLEVRAVSRKWHSEESAGSTRVLPPPRSGPDPDFHSAPGALASRTVYLPALPSARPRIAFYQSDDGFDLASTLSVDERHDYLPIDEILPIVLAAQSPAGARDAGRAHAQRTGSLLGGLSSAEGALCSGDVVIGINGINGLSAPDVVAVLEASQEPLRLTVR